MSHGKSYEPDITSPVRLFARAVPIGKLQNSAKAAITPKSVAFNSKPFIRRPAATAFFRFLRQPSRPNAPRPVAKERKGGREWVLDVVHRADDLAVVVDAIRVGAIGPNGSLSVV